MSTRGPEICVAASSLSCASKNNTNHTKLCKLLVNGGTLALRKVFDDIHPPHLLEKQLMEPENHDILKRLAHEKILTNDQWNMLHPQSGSKVDSGGFDIILLYLLLRNICNLRDPLEGWDRQPIPTSINTEDDIVRIKLYRNQLFEEAQDDVMSDEDFSKSWNGIKTVLIRLGLSESDINEIKSIELDPEDQVFYRQSLERWIMEKLETTEQKLFQKMNKSHNELTEKIDETRQQLQTNIDSKLDTVINLLQKATPSPKDFHDETFKEVEILSKDFKEAAQKLETLSPFQESLGLEDNFINLTMCNGSKDTTKSRLKTVIQSIDDIFVDKEKNEINKSIMVIGNPGIGKSLFCRKLVHDWAQDRLFDESPNKPVIKFAFLFSFRQLNIHRENVSLRELLNHSYNETTKINSSILEYIIQHPEQSLILFDGLDEYIDRQMMGNAQFESTYPNDPRLKMPVAALISKILKKKILSNSIVIVTSRPAEAADIKDLYFDKYLQLSSFSENQVLEYVIKYFESNEEFQRKALSVLNANHYYLSFGRVPTICNLMCIHINFHLSNSNKCFPQTLTQFYSEIVDCIEKNYNKAMKKDNLDAKTLYEKTDMIKDKMSELAAKTILDGKFTFSEEDLNQLQLSEVDRTYLQCSSLLFCECSVKKSAFSSEVVKLYSFCHTTFHEFLAARHFVTKMRRIPHEIQLTAMTLQFMAGSMVVGKDERLMEQLLEYIDDKLMREDRQSAVSLTCLQEFGDRNLSKIVVQTNKNHRYWDKEGRIRLSNIDINVVVLLLDIINSLNSNQLLSSPVPSVLSIRLSHFTVLTTQKLFELLTNTSCTITTLGLISCNIDDEYCLCLSQYLTRTIVTHLNLNSNQITDRGVDMLLDGCCQGLKVLWLSYNNITNVEHVSGLFRKKYPGLMLWISVK